MPAVPVVQAKSNFAKGKTKPAEKKPLDADGIADIVKTVTTQRKINDSAFIPVQARQDDDSNHSMQAFNPQRG